MRRWHRERYARSVEGEGFARIFDFTATGNGLYAARQLDDELSNIAYELRKPASEHHYRARAVGIVVSLYEFDLLLPVEEFIQSSTFGTDYFNVVGAYGMHHGEALPAVRARDLFLRSLRAPCSGPRTRR